MDNQQITREEYSEAVAGIAPETLTWGYDGKKFFFHTRYYKHRFATPSMMAQVVADIQIHHHLSRAQAVQRALCVSQWCFDDIDDNGFIKSYYV